MTDVDPELFYDAAGIYKENSDLAAAALHKLDGALDTANSAGTNGVGPDVARAYDGATDQVGQVAYRLVNVFSNLGGLLRQNGINHDQTEAASTLNQRDQYGAPVTPPGQTPGTYLDAGTDLGSIAGGDDPEPAHWDLVGDRITEGWPNGHPDRLLTAATAWEQYGHDLVAVNDLPSEQEYRLLTDVQAAEISTVIDRLNQARVISTDVAAASGDISRGTKDYGDKLASVKDDIAFIVDMLDTMITILDAYPPQMHRAVEPVKQAFIETAVSQINTLNEFLRASGEASVTSFNAASTSMGESIGQTKKLLDLAPRGVDPTPAQRVNENRTKGRRAEDIAGIDPTKKKERIQVVDPKTGEERTRIPDEIDNENRVVREVKNVKNLSATQQLRDMAQYAKSRGYKLVIVVDKGRTAGAKQTEAKLEELNPGLDVVIDDSLNLS